MAMETTVSLSVNSDRLQSRLYKLAEMGALEGGGVSRLALTDSDKMGRDLVVSWMTELGLDIAIDQIGNVVGTLKGQTDQPAVMMGSHIDTVSTAGIFDGNLGVLAGLEVIETIVDAGITPVRPLSVAFFTNEEGSRFAPDMMGSAVFTESLALETALETIGIDGKSVADELARIGYQGEDTSQSVSDTVSAYIELHVEQGPVLDELVLDIGVVEGVQGISWSEYSFHGTSNHAGTTPMSYRQDAGVVAAAVMSYVHQLAESMPNNQLATVGSIEFRPNLVNVIPNYARITVDLRNSNESELKRAESELEAFIASLVEKHGVRVEKKVLARFEPVIFDSNMVGKIESLAKESGMSTKRMFSGAGHDAQMFAPHCPTAMIFVPSQDGISHNIREHTTPRQVANGANLLLQTILKLCM
ncbi:M20 family metallo-hydrolase [Vibrio mediterranei]|uniref:M20 family metallo-hydrolase n=1 Tax=Vibrio mediterranei TaxID=689 RepID=UPI0040693A22